MADVSVHCEDLVVFGQQRLIVGGHNRVVVNVGNPRIRVDSACGLVDVRFGREAGTEVDELGDAAFGHEGHGPDQEGAVGASDLSAVRDNRNCPFLRPGDRPRSCPCPRDNSHTSGPATG